MGFIIKILLFPFRLISWIISWLLIAALIVICFSTPAEGISESQRGAISQNCSNIKQSLTQLQKVDSRTRTYLGTTYEAIATRFIIPLNLRLVKNNHPILPNIQSSFTLEQQKFRDSYTDYMRDLEALIGMDCQAQPDNFYSQLEIVRTKRAKLRETTIRLSALADDQYRAVLELRGSLVDTRSAL